MPRILIIDDEPDLRLALTATLEDHGYEVVVRKRWLRSAGSRREICTGCDHP
jgi:DNA-binding response OmpR family regulator